MSKSFEEILEEALDNAREDRKVLKQYRDQFGGSEIKDPEVAAAMAENLIEISDALTKSNAQIILAATLKLKHERATAPTKKEDDEFSEEEADDMFEAIGRGEDERN